MSHSVLRNRSLLTRVQVTPPGFIWLTGSSSSTLPTLQRFSRNCSITHFIAVSFLARFSYAKQPVVPANIYSARLTEPVWKPASDNEDTHQSSVVFAHMLHLLFRLQSWFLHLSQAVCHHGRPAGYPKQHQPCNEGEGSFLPKVLVAKSRTTEWNVACQSPNWRKKKQHPAFPPTQLCHESPWLMASTLKNVKTFPN